MSMFKTQELTKEQALAEIQAMLDRLGARQATQEEKARVALLLEVNAKGNPLVKDLTEAMQLVESAESPARPLEPYERAVLIATLTDARENKISLFAAMRKIGRDS